MPRKVINPKSTGSIRFATSQAGLATGDAVDTSFTDQVTSFRVVPSQNLTAIPATFGAPAAQNAAASSWQVEISYLQDWGNTDGVSRYLYDNDGVLLWFRFDPAGTTEDGFEGQVYVTAGAYGGGADQNWEDSQTWPCPVKPTRLAPA